MWPNSQETGDLITFIEEIFNGNLHFVYSDLRLSVLEFAEKSSSLPFLFSMSCCVLLNHWGSSTNRLLIRIFICKSWSVRIISVTSRICCSESKVLIRNSVFLSRKWITRGEQSAVALYFEHISHLFLTFLLLTLNM